MPGWDFVDEQDDVNPHILRMLEGTFSIDKSHIILFSKLNAKVLSTCTGNRISGKILIYM